jgi:hypothetical protein
LQHHQFTDGIDTHPVRPIGCTNDGDDGHEYETALVAICFVGLDVFHELIHSCPNWV